MRRTQFVLLLLGLLLLPASLALAQAAGYDLSWWTADNGGGTSTGGSYSLSGSIGQADAGSLGGGGYVLWGGFQMGAGAPTAGRLHLPLLQKRYQPPFRDDFSDPNSGWPKKEDETASRGYVNGEYRILVKKPDTVVMAGRGLLVTDFECEVEARNAADARGSYGIYFPSGEETYYVYDIISRTNSFRLIEYSLSGEYLRSLIEERKGPVILKEKNRLKVVRHGTTITLYVNGEPQPGGTWEGKVGQGDVGLVATGYPAGYDARFDNFLLVYNATGTMAQARGPATVVSGEGQAPGRVVPFR